MVTQLLLIDPSSVTAGPRPAVQPGPGASGQGRRAGRTAGDWRDAVARPSTRRDSGIGRTPPERPQVDATPQEQSWWRLDDHTRELGQRGVEDARRALAAAVERVTAA